MAAPYLRAATRQSILLGTAAKQSGQHMHDLHLRKPPLTCVPETTPRPGARGSKKEGPDFKNALQPGFAGDHFRPEKARSMSARAASHEASLRSGEAFYKESQISLKSSRLTLSALALASMVLMSLSKARSSAMSASRASNPSLVISPGFRASETE